MLPLVGSLATFFGERPLEIVMFDADEERLDLVDRFARLAFAGSKATHSLRSTSDSEEALEDAGLVVLQIEENCARKLTSTKRGEPDPTEKAIALLLGHVPERAHLLSLIGDKLPYEGFYAMDWPDEPTEEDIRAIPHQILRFLNGEEYLYQLFKQYQASPLKAWLNDPTFSARAIG